MNRKELEKKLNCMTSSLLRQKGYISFPDVFVSLGVLDPKDVEAWRFGRVPDLERVVKMNLSRISFVMKKVRSNCLDGGLKPGRTAYLSWGKGRKRRLQFSRSGAPPIEDLWATHFVDIKIDPLSNCGEIATLKPLEFERFTTIEFDGI